jgi:hypothetical protein
LPEVLTEVSTEVSTEVLAKRALKIDFLDRLWEGWDATEPSG